MRILKLAVFLLLPVLAHTQDLPSPSLNIGDPAPQLRVRDWLKGTPIKKFRKGNVYVVEFWATWCAPCRAAMPHLSNLAREYKDRITFIGVDVWERKTTSMDKIRRFVDSMGHRMDYNVAADDNDLMVAGWLQASGEQGIPRTFVIDAKGRIAWIGHPQYLATVLQRMRSKPWSIEEALAKRISDKRLARMDFAMLDYLNIYHEKPDLMLIEIAKIVKNEPLLKYTPVIANCTFSALLKTKRLQEAYEYGKAVMVTPTYTGPAYEAIIGAIMWNSDKLDHPEDFYRLGAEAHQAILDHPDSQELLNIQKRYNQMAEWYWRANDRLKALDAMHKGFQALKSKQGLLPTEVALFAFQLRQYENRELNE